ncbi:ABC transporter permease [Variovorax terrae]|nr:ABC transporter permease [Variovorax terrae]
MGLLRALWGYRGFIFGTVKREFRSRYNNSLLGAAWTVINPLAMIFVYTVIFSRVMQARLPGTGTAYAYGIYLCAGILTWGLTAEITGRCVNTFLENANLLKKLTFPRLSLPVIVVLTALFNFGIIFGLFTLFLVISGNFPGWAFFAIFPVLAVQLAFSVGLGVCLGVLNVFFRDVGQLYGVLLQFWFWLTPIVYPAEVLPAKVRELIALNPMTTLIQAYQDILLRGALPNWRHVAVVAGVGLLLCIAGLSLFRRHSSDMVDEL